MLDPRKGQYVRTECTNFMTKDFFTDFNFEATKTVWIRQPKFSNHNTLKHHNFSDKSITKKGRWWRIVLVLKWQRMKLNCNAMWRGFKRQRTWVSQTEEKCSKIFLHFIGFIIKLYVSKARDHSGISAGSISCRTLFDRILHWPNGFLSILTENIKF